MSATAARFFAPTYFSPYYFAPLVSNTGGSGASSSAYRDKDAFASIVKTLKETGEFADVVFGVTAALRPGGADSAPVSVVMPESWVETDDADPILLVRRIFYTVTIVARAEDPVARFDSLDRLSCVVQNVLDGADLGGGCLAALTKTRWGSFEAASSFPEQSVVLHGEFAYLVPTMDGRNTTY